MSSFMNRVAGAPITWGVDGSPGWGHILDRDRVFAEMREVGLAATELGPDGYLPLDRDDLDRFLDQFQLHVVGGFVPAVLYRDDLVEDSLDYVRRAAQQLAGSGSKVLVLGPSSHLDGYDTQVDMDDDDWKSFLRNLARLDDIVQGEGMTTALHPHWGMVIENGRHVDRLLESSDTGLCLDTGHLFLAGTDPVEVAKAAPGRVHHVHLKDVDNSFAEKVRSGEKAFHAATVEGMFTPLGGGDVDIAGVVETLEAAGYQGWYVLEHDVALSDAPPEGEGPKVDAMASVTYLRGLAAITD